MEEEIHPKIYLYKRVVDAKLFIENNFHLPLVLDAVAKKACFSKFHFSRLFKESFGLSPNQYLTEVRIKKAKELLSQKVSVSDVCYQTGFQSIPTFSNLFKRHTGLSPKLFAKQAQNTLEKQRNQPLNYIPSCIAESYGWNKSKNE